MRITFRPVLVRVMLAAWAIAIGLSMPRCQATDAGGDAAPDPEWYADSFIHSHMSIGLISSKFPGVEFRRQVSAVRPDAISFHSGHGTARQISAELAFRHVMNINLAGSWRRGYEKDKRYVFRVNADGSRTGRMKRGELSKHLCFNSPAVDEIIVPKYVEAAKRFHPPQIWIDENIISVNLCWCPNCRSLFKKECGVRPPGSADDPHWETWAAFHRACFTRWMKKITDAVRDVDPNTIVTFNHAYFVGQPETPPSFIRNLSADIHHTPLRFGLYARYGAACGVPFDIMPGLGSDTWAGKRPKPLSQVLEDIAIITANGGRWNIGEFPTWGERPVEKYVELARKGAEFARARQTWTHRTESIPYVAILHSASTHYSKVLPHALGRVGKTGGHVLTSDGTFERVTPKANPGRTRVYWVNNRPVSEDITGAYEALLESHVHFDIINEDTLEKRLGGCALLVLAEQFRLEGRTVERIRRYVRSGGCLLATGSTINAGLGDVLGLDLADGQHGPSASLLFRGKRLTFGLHYKVSPTTAEVLQYFDEPAGSPAVTLNRSGKGAATYMSANIFDLYHRQCPLSRKPKGDVAPLRELVRTVLDRVMPERPTRISAPPWIEIALRRKGASMLVQLINRAIEWRGKAAEAHGPICINLRVSERPSRVVLQPGADHVDWRWADGWLHAEVPIGEVGVHRILEVKGVLPNRKSADIRQPDRWQ